MQKKTEDVFSINNSKTEGRTESYVRICWEFFKIGTFTIGGGAAMIPQMQQIAVDEKKWLSEEEMLDCIALGQSLPGVIAINMTTFIGYKQRGIPGALVATFGVVLPAFLAILIALALLEYIGDNQYVEGAFIGVKAAVCGLIVVSAVRLVKQMCTATKQSKLKIAFTVIMFALSFIAVAFFGITAIAIILVAIVIGIIFHCLTLKQEVGR